MTMYPLTIYLLGDPDSYSLRIENAEQHKVYDESGFFKEYSPIEEPMKINEFPEIKRRGRPPKVR
jgi:hypothetical protein